ncbi:MAG: ABC transporter substrate-binding protein [Pseudomonadota bacterium]
MFAASPALFASADELVEARQVNEFHAKLGYMAGLAAHTERESFISATVAELFDVQRIAKVSVGRHWSALVPAQRTQFTEHLLALISATYAQRFAAAVPVFEVVDQQQARGGVLVSGQLTAADGRIVRLDYFFRDGKVFNIAADGVSDLSLRRADYSQVMQDSGFAALLAHLSAKTKEARQTAE